MNSPPVRVIDFTLSLVPVNYCSTRNCRAVAAFAQRVWSIQFGQGLLGVSDYFTGTTCFSACLHHVRWSLRATLFDQKLYQNVGEISPGYRFFTFYPSSASLYLPKFWFSIWIYLSPPSNFSHDTVHRSACAVGQPATIPGWRTTSSSPALFDDLLTLKPRSSLLMSGHLHAHRLFSTSFFLFTPPH